MTYSLYTQRALLWIANHNVEEQKDIEMAQAILGACLILHGIIMYSFDLF